MSDISAKFKDFAEEVVLDFTTWTGEAIRRFSDDDRKSVEMALNNIAMLKAQQLTSPGEADRFGQAIESNINGLEFIFARYQIEGRVFLRNFLQDLAGRIISFGLSAVLGPFDDQEGG